MESIIGGNCQRCHPFCVKINPRRSIAFLGAQGLYSLAAFDIQEYFGGEVNLFRNSMDYQRTGGNRPTLDRSPLQRISYTIINY